MSLVLGSFRATRRTDGGEVARGEGGVRGELRSGLPAVVLLLLGTLGISTAFGMLLLLPLYVQELGGDEADYGVVLSAAAVPAVLCIGLLIRYPEVLRPHVVVALAIATYGIGAGGASLVSGGWAPLVGIGVLLGTAWAVVYAASPMAMSRMVTDEGRAAYFGYLTGTQQVGIGVGPVISRFLVETPLGFRGTFLVAGFVCLIAMALTLAVGTLLSDAGTATGKEGAEGNASSPVSFGVAMRRIFASEAAFSLAMILLFACLFTTMTSFQPTFASARGLDYSVFYVAYTVAVIFSRFVLAGVAARFDSRLVIAGSVSVMALAVASFLAVGSHGVFYGISSAFLGLGYGLALPGVQAQAVNVSEEQVRPRVLPMAGMLFEGAILGFPLVAGWVITSFGYRALFAVLLAFALVQVTIAWWRFLVAGRSKGTQEV
jgi:MFS family permease